MGRQDSDWRDRNESERGFSGGDRRRGFSRDYERHSKRRFRDQNRDVDYGSDLSRDYDRRSSFGSEGMDRDDYQRSKSESSRFGSESYKPRSEENRHSSWGLQGDRDLYGSYGSGSSGSGRYDDNPIGQSHWGHGQYRDMHDRDSLRRDTRRYDDRFSRDHQSNFFERLGEKVGEFFGKGPKGYKRSDDRIREDVSEALWAHPQIDASEIEVEVRDGVVTLSGTVTERRMKRMIEDEIEYLPGVKDVINNVRTQERQSSSLMGSDPTSTSTASSSGLGSSGSLGMKSQNTSDNGNRGRKTQ